MPEFQQAFSCKKGQAMVRENACRVWQAVVRNIPTAKPEGTLPGGER